MDDPGSARPDFPSILLRRLGELAALAQSLCIRNGLSDNSNGCFRLVVRKHLLANLLKLREVSLVEVRELGAEAVLEALKHALHRLRLVGICSTLVSEKESFHRGELASKARDLSGRVRLAARLSRLRLLVLEAEYDLLLLL